MSTEVDPAAEPHAGESGNLFLDALPAEVADSLRERATLVQVDTHQQIWDVGEPFEHFDFPVDAGYSSVATFNDGSMCEVALVGREGVSPPDYFLGVRAARRTVVCQIPGRVLRIEASTVVEHLERYPQLREHARNYIASRIFIAEQLMACNALHTLYRRCARWLLMSRDRVGRDSFHLTHEYLATMLGVRRAGVTEVAGELQALGAIVYSRGKVTVVDADKLTAASCSCYGEVAELARRGLRRVDDEAEPREVSVLP